MAEAKLQTDMQQQQIPLPHRVFNALFELHIQLAGKDTLAQCQKQKGTGDFFLAIFSSFCLTHIRASKLDDHLLFGTLLRRLLKQNLRVLQSCSSKWKHLRNEGAG
jgi:hypothetical protein